MATNSFINDPKTGKCHMCLRQRKVDVQVKKVGEINHGFAIGYKWECIDTDECDKMMKHKLANTTPETLTHVSILSSLEYGRYTEYRYFT